MAATDVAVANSALAKLGNYKITALSDTTREAVLLNEQYAKVRNDLLYCHPWNFAIKRVELVVNVTPPIFGFANKFDLPTDYLRILETDSQDWPWEKEGEYILSDASAVFIKYIAKITDPLLFNAAFDELFALKLAVDIAFALTQNATLKKTLMDEYDQKLREARSFDAQEGGLRVVNANAWLNSRF